MLCSQLPLILLYEVHTLDATLKTCWKHYVSVDEHLFSALVSCQRCVQLLILTSSLHGTRPLNSLPALQKLPPVSPRSGTRHPLHSPCVSLIPAIILISLGDLGLTLWCFSRAIYHSLCNFPVSSSSNNLRSWIERVHEYFFFARLAARNLQVATLY